MKTPTKDCSGTVEGIRERQCLPCDIETFCRNHYYRGKLLTERDFSDEQRYFIDKHRLHNIALHGWGIVCGLIVKPHPYCPELRVVIESGLAIDDCGREIRVLRPIETLLPKAPPRKPQEPHHDEPPGDHGHGEGHGQDHGSGHDHDHDDDYRQDREPKHERHPPDRPPEPYPDDEEQPLPPNPCDDTPVPKNLYLCIRYSECDTEFAPAPFDDCGCNNDGQQPNRICEGFAVTLLEEKPDWWDHAVEDECKSDDCEEIFRQAQKCAVVNRFPCIPLAVIRNFEPGKKVAVGQIDNWSERKTLSSSSTIEKVVECILEKLPTREMTRIMDINWEHGERLLCHQFMNMYVGSTQTPRGFEIRFDSKVSANSIDTRSLQAMVVFRPEDLSESRLMEIAPAHIYHDTPETEWCRLQIDPGYARRRLDGKNFDLFITLKCNVVTGKNGLAVDGDFLATKEADDVWRMALPTGDNVPGGTFESWLRVRPRPKGSSEEPRRSAS